MSGSRLRAAVPAVCLDECIEVETSRVRLGAAICRIGRLLRRIEATYQEIDTAANNLDSRQVAERFEFLEAQVRRAEIELAANRERIAQIRAAIARIRNRTHPQF